MSTTNAVVCPRYLRICRAALRVPQSDDLFPLASHNDHLGAVALARLTAVLEVGVNRADVAALECSKWLKEDHGDGLKSLLEDAAWLMQETLHRAMRTGQEQRGTRCQISLPTLPLLAYALGQLAGTVSSVDFATTVEMETFLRRLSDILVSGGHRQFPGAHSRVASGAVAAMVDSLTAFVTAANPTFIRPMPSSCVRLGVTRTSERNWGVHQNNILQHLKLPLDGPKRNTVTLSAVQELLTNISRQSVDQTNTRARLLTQTFEQLMILALSFEDSSNRCSAAANDLANCLLSTPLVERETSQTVLRVCCQQSSQSPRLLSSLSTYLSASVLTSLISEAAGSPSNFAATLSDLDSLVSSLQTDLLESLGRESVGSAALLAKRSDALLDVTVMRGMQSQTRHIES